MSVLASGALAGVSRETHARLTTFADLVVKWQVAQNLVAGGTLEAIWERHIADSAQLVDLFPDTRRWVDLGSGGGFPGLVVAIFMADVEGGHVDLVESNRRKCAFLRTAIRETRAAADVREGRIEQELATIQDGVERITARAVAPLPRLLELAEPLTRRNVPAAFHKGQDFVVEIDEASQSWEFDLVVHQSRTGEGVILDLRQIRRRTHSDAHSGDQP